jgi:hypothetical protein
LADYFILKQFQRPKVNTIGWSVPNPDIVLTADDSGYIVIWDVQVCC